MRKFVHVLAEQPDVVYFCDSTNRWIDDEDVDRRPIAGILEDYMAGESVCALDNGSWHAQIYDAFLDAMIRQESVPSKLVIPINLRSFSPEWHKRPQYQFPDLIAQLEVSKRPWKQGLFAPMKMLGLSTTTGVSPHEFMNTPVYFKDDHVGRVCDFTGPKYDIPTPELTRNKFILHYMYPLQVSHPKLKALRRIAEKCHDHQVQAVFYITPVDIRTGQQAIPGEFAQWIQRNCNVICRAVQSSGGVVLNLSEALAPADFSWHLYPNEHMCQTGRSFVAAEVATAFSAEHTSARTVALPARSRSISVRPVSSSSAAKP
ncbi:MAG: hypothetical protein P8J37_01055 [Fuerstiella sp.]|nr:hypothetical protein [Fuerstiella sp.]